MHVPGLTLPTLVLWGASDRIVSPTYGQQFADLIPGTQFSPVPQAGRGRVGFWRVVGDVSGPKRLQLVKPDYALPLRRGVHTLAIVRQRMLGNILAVSNLWIDDAAYSAVPFG